MSETLPSIDEIEAMLPAMEALEELIDEGLPREGETNCGACYYCSKGHGHEPFCVWDKTRTALEKWKEVRNRR